MTFVDKGERTPKEDDLPSRLIVVTLLELLGYFYIVFLAGSIIGPFLLSLILYE